MAVFLFFRKDRYSRCLLLGKELICGQNGTALVYNRRAVWFRLSVRSCQRSMLPSRSQSVIGSSHRRSRSPNQGIWNAKESGFWGILAETTGRETQVSCSVGVDGIAQKIQKSRAVRGGDLRQQILPRPLSSG